MVESTQEVYRQLANRLDTIPNGFTPTESGVEFRLLSKLFTPEEAALAAVMRLTREPAETIADRAGAEPSQARRTLKDMVRKGLIRAKKGQGELLFGLMPFAVGIYEEQLGRIDEEMALLFEQYYQETQGGSLVHSNPPLQRVIPVGEAIPVDVEVFPYEQAVAMIENAKSWGVRDCICRVQQQLIGKGCDHQVHNCLVFAPVENVFGDEVNQAISKEEALRILQQSEEEGLIHSVSNHQDHLSYICNCCTCCCGLLRGLAEFAVPSAIAKSRFRAQVDEDACIGCEECVPRCQLAALVVSAESGICQVDEQRCIGCGVCVLTCPSDALTLVGRSQDRVDLPPTDRRDWMVRRAQDRGIRLEDVL